MLFLYMWVKCFFFLKLKKWNVLLNFIIFGLLFVRFFGIIIKVVFGFDLCEVILLVFLYII